MSTATLTTAEPTTTTTSRRPRRLARIVAAFAVVLAGLTGTTLAAAPAQAATQVTGCFRSPSSSVSVAGVGVQLQAYWQGQWYTIWNGTVPQSQCVTVNTPNHSGYYLRYAVNYSRYGATWYGTSPYYANPGYGTSNIGTTTVKCIGCVVG